MVPLQNSYYSARVREETELIFDVLWNPVDCSDTKHCEIGHKMSGSK